jgi:signal transduction histidine kinase
VVADNGRGIPRERIAELCRPFVQIQDSLRRDVGGMGLGLAISRSLAEAMQGSLVIDSDLGKGTIVRVILPVAEI